VISSLSNLNIGSYYGQTATINGSININSSTNIYLYGLSITNPFGDGVTVNDSRGVTLDTCASNGNAGHGLAVSSSSNVNINASGSFDNNGTGGINASRNSYVQIVAWVGTVDISNNAGPGVWASQANFTTDGSTSILNNTFGPNSTSGFGIDLFGGAHAQIGAISGPNVITGNQSGGVRLQETAEISFFTIGQPNLIENNGPVGISAGLGSQVTLAALAPGGGAAAVPVQVSGHSSAGVEVYANSQLYVLGQNVIHGNGSATDSRSAGIRLDGDSEALLRGGEVSGNNGPGLLALVNSSADFTGVAFSGNAQGTVISCDSSSYVVSDLIHSPAFPPPGVLCKTPHNLGNRQFPKWSQPFPSWSAQKSAHDRYAKFAVKH
jgi:hypothetical protein